MNFYKVESRWPSTEYLCIISVFSFAALSQAKMNIPGEIHQSDSNTNKVEIENNPNPDFNYNPGGWAIEPRPDPINPLIQS